METIDVSGLPEPLARQIQAMVGAFRKQLGGKETRERRQQRITLPVWRGNVKGALTRNDIYDDLS